MGTADSSGTNPPPASHHGAEAPRGSDGGDNSSARGGIRMELDALHGLLLNKNGCGRQEQDDRVRTRDARLVAREDRKERYEKMQRMQQMRVMAATEDDRRRAREANDRRDESEAELYRMLEDELATSRQNLLRLVALFQERLKEKEEQQKEIIAALRNRP